MRIHFTKMQGAGNDFVVLDETVAPLGLTKGQYRWLADRRFGVGADQILSVRAAPDAGCDFAYAIHNADGGEVEHCGNGARCFYQFVHERGLTASPQIRVRTVNRLLTLGRDVAGEVAVDMGLPAFAPEQVPFVTDGLAARTEGAGELWRWGVDASGRALELAVASMGNPHALVRVHDVDATPVEVDGPRIGADKRFPQGVNVGFMQVLARDRVRLRVYERGAGETLACGTGACAAVALGIRLGWLDRRVQVLARGGKLHVQWDNDSAHLFLSGPAVTVFSGDIDVPEL